MQKKDGKKENGGKNEHGLNPVHFGADQRSSSERERKKKRSYGKEKNNGDTELGRGQKLKKSRKGKGQKLESKEQGEKRVEEASKSARLGLVLQKKGCALRTKIYGRTTDREATMVRGGLGKRTQPGKKIPANRSTWLRRVKRIGKCGQDPIKPDPNGTMGGGRALGNSRRERRNANR